MANRKETWRRAIIPEDSTIHRAIRNLDEVAIKIVLVENDKGELAGTISDGDIRRGLLRGLDLDSPIESIIHRTPLVVTPEIDRKMLIQLMLANGIHQIPVINKNHQVIDLHLWDQMAEPVQRKNFVVIMAGGMGTRLHPHTKTCPKPMLPVSGKPILEHIIERAKSHGFSNFMLSINYLGHLIESHFESGGRWGVNIEYLREDVPLGTAGALSLFPNQPENPIVVTNGDVLTDVDYGELLDFHVRFRADATMAVSEHKWQHPFGVVETEGIDIVSIEEKPVARSHINAGVYVLSPGTLKLLNKNEHCDMPTLFQLIKENGGRSIAYPMHEPWLDVGRPTDLDAAQKTGNKKIP